MPSKIAIPDPILPAVVGLWLISASVVVDLVGIGNPNRFGLSQVVCLVGGVILLGLALVLLHRTASREARSSSRSYGRTLSVALTAWACAAALPVVLIEGAARLSEPVEAGDYRAFDPVLGWSLIPDRLYHVKSVRKDFEFPLRVDRHGFRDDGQQIGQVSDARVVVLGDSNAFGVGLSDDKVLSHQLHDSLLTRGVDVKVLNAGVPGYGLDQFFLRLKSLGKLAPGTVVVLLIHPMNDLVNLSSDVDYSMSRPAAVVQGGRLQFLTPSSNRRTDFPAHFSPMFSDLNRVFELPEPVTYRVPSAAVSMVRGERRLQLSRQQQGSVHEMVDSRSLLDVVAKARLAIEVAPLFNASRVWTEIRQFESERKTLASLVDALFAAMQEHARSCQCRILAVLAPEPDRVFAYSKGIMDHLMEVNPQFDFDFGTSRELLRQGFSRSGVHYIPIEYAADEAERMFLKADGHTGVLGMERIAEATAAYMAEHAWLPAPN